MNDREKIDAMIAKQWKEAGMDYFSSSCYVHRQAELLQCEANKVYAEYLADIVSTQAEGEVGEELTDKIYDLEVEIIKLETDLSSKRALLRVLERKYLMDKELIA